MLQKYFSMLYLVFLISLAGVAHCTNGSEPQSYAIEKMRDTLFITIIGSTNLQGDICQVIKTLHKSRRTEAKRRVARRSIAEHTDAEHTDAELTEPEDTEVECRGVAEHTDAEHTEAEHTEAEDTEEELTEPEHTPDIVTLRGTKKPRKPKSSIGTKRIVYTDFSRFSPDRSALKTLYLVGVADFPVGKAIITIISKEEINPITHVQKLVAYLKNVGINEISIDLDGEVRNF